jgi:hypothetical protein
VPPKLGLGISVWVADQILMQVSDLMESTR